MLWEYQVDSNKLTVLENEEDVHVLAGSLKLFFREMREPLIPTSVFSKFLSACRKWWKTSCITVVVLI